MADSDSSTTKTAAAAAAASGVSLDQIVLFFFAALGAGLLLVRLSSVLSFLRARYFYSNSKTLLREFGTWACVTGATDGIGKEIALGLAKRGFNLVLISRTQERLEAMAEEIKVVFPTVHVKVLAIDYSRFDAEAQGNVKKTLEPLGADLGILVNNVGVSYDFPEFFHELTDEKVRDMIEMNINSTTWMTRIVLPQMLARTDKKKNKNAPRASIINIGSAAGLHTNPLLAQYSAAKAYLQAFTQSLHAEYAKSGIEVSCHTPYFIVSKLSKFKKPTFFVPSPKDFARLVVGAIGSGQIILNPYIPHAILGHLLTHLPEKLVGSVIMGHHLGIRKRGQEKRATKADCMCHLLPSLNPRSFHI